MTTRTVHTQAELDGALKEHVDTIQIDAPRGVWIYLSASGSSTVEAYGSSTVRASGSSTVRAYGSSTVRASDSSTVEASGSSTVEASGSSTVRAYGSSTVRASDSSTVEAYGSSTVRASKYVAIHLWSKQVHLDGGVLIDLTDLDLDDADTWLSFKGVEVTDGKAIVYKCVDEELVAGWRYKPTSYDIGTTVTALDWKPTRECGHGLHFVRQPFDGDAYFAGSGAKRYIACEVEVEGLIALSDKVKAQSCRVLYEVNRYGKRLEQVTA